MSKQEDKLRIAVVDDYVNAAETIATYVRCMGCVPSVFTSPVAFLDALKSDTFDIVITDIRMPEMDGLSLLKEVRERAPDSQVIVVSGHAEKEDAIEALKFGACDFFEKPVGKDECEAAIKRTARYQAVLRERDRLRKQLSYISEQEVKRWGLHAFVGQHESLGKLAADIRSLQKVDRTTVLILGESGTGKELVARALHAGSERKSGPFVPVNCSAIPGELAESILFGHVKGSFTGAASDRKGAFELANEGTLFLDEIGDMSPDVQAKLLRVLEDGIVNPVGATKGSKVNVRIVAATNTDLEKKIEMGEFRGDLFHRLAAFTLDMPPLRDRKSDIPLLVEHFVKELSLEMGFAEPKVIPEAMDMLMRYEFPGNVRELKNVIEQALIRSRGEEITEEHIHLSPGLLRPSSGPESASQPSSSLADLPLNLAEMEKLTVKRAMEKTGGNVSEAARLLGISRNKLYSVLSKA